MPPELCNLLLDLDIKKDYVVISFTEQTHERQIDERKATGEQDRRVEQHKPDIPLSLWTQATLRLTLAS